METQPPLHVPLSRRPTASIVEQAENSKLKAGNTFRCALFILGEPLYMNDLVQGDNPPVAFVVGNKDGLCELSRIRKMVPSFIETQNFASLQQGTG